MEKDNSYYPYFDWLRGILAITVMLSHQRIIPCHYAGHFAVQVFFALSGWLIGGILLKYEVADLPRFYFNRSIRIWIPYYLALILLLVAAVTHDKITSKWQETVVYMTTFVFNVYGSSQSDIYREQMPLNGTGNCFWSINAEEQFYLIAPLLLVLLPKRFGRSWITWVIVATLTTILKNYTSIAFGVLAAVLVNRFGNFQATRAGRSISCACLLAMIPALIDGTNYPVFAPYASIAIVLLLTIKGKQGPIGSMIGGMSYQLYLNHWIGIFVGNAVVKLLHIPESTLRYILPIPVNLALSIALYWLIDRQLHLARSSCFTRSRGVAAMIVAYGMILLGVAYHAWLVSQPQRENLNLPYMSAVRH